MTGRAREGGCRRANGRLKAVKYGGNTIASYSYDAVGNRTRVDHGNGTYTTFDYESGDPRYRLETITHYDPDDEALATFGYTRDDVGNPLSFTTFEGAWAYTYDAMSRLASATPPGVPLPAQTGGSYDYDWVGNMKAAASSNPWQFNAADQLTLWPGMHSYEYDDNGALTAVKTPDGQAEQQTFTYHPTGLMNVATFNNQTQTLTNLWDADEHRVQFSIGEDEYTAVFDVTAGIPAVIKETTPQGTIYYVREPGGELICRVVTVGETTHRWFYHFDELGSTRLITDSSGAVTDSYSYDAYGALLVHDRNMGTIDQPYQYVGQLGYYTHWMAPELSWLQLGVRLYDPETGRFERRDPVREGIDESSYCYVRGAVLSTADPTGLSAMGVLLPEPVIPWPPAKRYDGPIIRNPTRPRKPSFGDYWGCMSLCMSTTGMQIIVGGGGIGVVCGGPGFGLGGGFLLASYLCHKSCSGGWDRFVYDCDKASPAPVEFPHDMPGMGGRPRESERLPWTQWYSQRCR